MSKESWKVPDTEEGCGWKIAMGNRLIVLLVFCGGIVVRFWWGSGGNRKNLEAAVGTQPRLTAPNPTRGARAGSVAERDVRYIFKISICSVTCVFHLGNFYRFMEFARVLMKQNIFLKLQRFYRIWFIYLSSILKWM